MVLSFSDFVFDFCFVSKVVVKDPQLSDLQGYYTTYSLLNQHFILIIALIMDENVAIFSVGLIGCALGQNLLTLL